MKIALLPLVALALSAGMFLGQHALEGLGNETGPAGITCDSIVQDQGRSLPAGSGMSIDIYRNTLPSDVSPAVWVERYPAVVHVRVNESMAACETADDSVNGPPFVATTMSAEAIEYIKGDGPKTVQLTFWGGELNGFLTEVDGLVSPSELPPGTEAVVFLEAADGSWRVENAYAFTGGTARSQVDNRELPVNELLPALRDAAAQEAAAD